MTEDKPQACLFCSGDAFTKVLSVPKSSLFVCRRCGLAVRFPRLGSREQASFYSDDYYRGTNKTHFDGSRLQVYRTDFRLVEKMAPGRRLLDFGCGLGHFLAMARDRGWDVTGIELSRKASETARESFKLQVVEGDEKQLEGFGGEFDAVTLWNVLDQVHDPFRTVRAVRPVLRKGGCLLARVMNLQSRRMLHSIGTRLRAGFLTRNFGFFHEYAFTPAFLRRMFLSLGFSRVLIRNSTIAGDTFENRLSHLNLVNGLCAFTGMLSMNRLILSPSLLVVAVK